MTIGLQSQPPTRNRAPSTPSQKPGALGDIRPTAPSSTGRLPQSTLPMQAPAINQHVRSLLELVNEGCDALWLFNHIKAHQDGYNQKQEGAHASILSEKVQAQKTKKKSRTSTYKALIGRVNSKVMKKALKKLVSNFFTKLLTKINLKRMWPTRAELLTAGADAYQPTSKRPPLGKSESATIGSESEDGIPSLSECFLELYASEDHQKEKPFQQAVHKLLDDPEKNHAIIDILEYLDAYKVDVGTVLQALKNIQNHQYSVSPALHFTPKTIPDHRPLTNNEVANFRGFLWNYSCADITPKAQSIVQSLINVATPLSKALTSLEKLVGFKENIAPHMFQHAVITQEGKLVHDIADQLSHLLSELPTNLRSIGQELRSVRTVLLSKPENGGKTTLRSKQEQEQVAALLTQMKQLKEILPSEEQVSSLLTRLDTHYGALVPDLKEKFEKTTKLVHNTLQKTTTQVDGVSKKLFKPLYTLWQLVMAFIARLFGFSKSKAAPEPQTASKATTSKSIMPATSTATSPTTSSATDITSAVKPFGTFDYIRPKNHAQVASDVLLEAASLVDNLAKVVETFNKTTFGDLNLPKSERQKQGTHAGHSKNILQWLKSFFKKDDPKARAHAASILSALHDWIARLPQVLDGLGQSRTDIQAFPVVQISNIVRVLNQYGLDLPETPEPKTP